MTRTPIIAGNWKMHMTLDESVAFVEALLPVVADYATVEKVVCPTFISVAAVAKALEGSPLKVGAQNVHWEAKGAYTSQVSPEMLKGLVEYVIIGHSECRQYLGETDEIINKKVHAALAAGLKVILAVGETDAQNQAGETDTFVSGQIRAGLHGVTEAQLADVVVAYEPIWAIGTGRSASGEEANAIIRDTVRATLIDLYGATAADGVRIQYGGSVKPSNLAEYMQYPDIDGALVGGAALKVDDFAQLIAAAAAAKA